MIAVLLSGLIFFAQCLVFLSAIGIVVYFLKFKHKIDVTRNIPCAPTWPILGHAQYFINKGPYFKIMLLTKWADTYGKVLKVWLGPELNILTNDIKDVEIILGTTRFNDKAHEYDTLRPWLSEGLLISRGKKWHQRRKVLTPAFHFKILDQFIEVFESESRALLKNLDKESRMQTPDGFEIYEWVNLATLDTICKAAMGVTVNAQSNADSEYVRAVKTISMVLHKRMFELIYRFDFTYRLTPLARQERKALAVLHGFTEKVIVQRREELMREQSESKSPKDATDDEVGAKRKMAFLDILLQSEIDGKPLSNLDIREEVDTFMFEGHDTTSSAITFALYNLARNPKCQQKFFEEIVQVMGKDPTKPVSYDLLNQMSYAELCIKETLRMFPSVPLLGRRVYEECEINGKIVPAGTNIGISPLYMGHMAELFPEPSSFKPERFETMGYGGSEKVSPYAYIPFSAGPRNCIGQKFAMLELKTMLVNIFRYYEVEYMGTEEMPSLIGELILRTKDPLMFKIKPRVY